MRNVARAMEKIVRERLEVARVSFENLANEIRPVCGGRHISWPLVNHESMSVSVDLPLVMVSIADPYTNMTMNYDYVRVGFSIMISGALRAIIWSAESMVGEDRISLGDGGRPLRAVNWKRVTKEKRELLRIRLRESIYSHIRVYAAQDEYEKSRIADQTLHPHIMGLSPNHSICADGKWYATVRAFLEKHDAVYAMPAYLATVDMASQFNHRSPYRRVFDKVGFHGTVVDRYIRRQNTNGGLLQPDDPPLEAVPYYSETKCTSCNRDDIPEGELQRCPSCEREFCVRCIGNCFYCGGGVCTTCCAAIVRSSDRGERESRLILVCRGCYDHHGVGICHYCSHAIVGEDSGFTCGCGNRLHIDCRYDGSTYMCDTCYDRWRRRPTNGDSTG